MTILCREPGADMFAVSWRARACIDGNIHDFAAGTAYKFALGKRRRLIMKAADCTFVFRIRKIVLNEFNIRAGAFGK